MNTRYTYHIRGVAENAWADQWYIGSRTATHGRTPEEDIGIHYFTSSSNKDFVAQFKAHPDAEPMEGTTYAAPSVHHLSDESDG